MSNLPNLEDVYGDENYRFFKRALKKRVSEKRYRHSKGVAKCSRKLAEVYGCEPLQARMAGILHDWDKGLSGPEIIARAEELGVTDIDPETARTMPWLLHGPTAAAALSREFPELGDGVFQAIARHTNGAADMAPLDCIVYVADIIEPNRTFGDEGGIERLRGLVGEVSLEELFYEGFRYNFMFLVERQRQLWPGTLEVWNALVPRFGFMREFK